MSYLNTIVVDVCILCILLQHYCSRWRDDHMHNHNHNQKHTTRRKKMARAFAEGVYFSIIFTTNINTGLQANTISLYGHIRVGASPRSWSFWVRVPTEVVRQPCGVSELFSVGVGETVCTVSKSRHFQLTQVRTRLDTIYERLWVRERRWESCERNEGHASFPFLLIYWLLLVAI